MPVIRWLNHQIDVGLYPLVLISVFLCAMDKQGYIVVWIIGLIYLIYRRFDLMIILWIGIGLWFQPPNTLNESIVLNNSIATVKSLHASSVLVDSEYGHYYLIAEQSLTIGNHISVSGEITPSSGSSSFYGFDSQSYNASKHIIGSVFDGDITVVDDGYSIQGMVQRLILNCFGSTKGWRLIDILWFNQDTSMVWLVVSSYVYITLINGFIRLLSFGLTKKYCDIIRMVLTLIIGICFGFSFVLYRQLIRYGLNHFNLDRITRFSITVLFWLFLSNGYVQSIGFLFPFCFSWFSLMHPLSKTKGMLISLFIQGICLHQINLLSIISFGFTRVLSALFFILSIVSVLSGSSITLALPESIENILMLYGSPLGYGLIIYLLLVGLFKRFRYRYILYVLLYIGFTYRGWFQPLAQLYCINVGQGDATLIKDAFNQTVILVDTGKASAYDELTTALHGAGITHIDALIITHDDADHSDNKEAIMQDFNVDQCIEEPFDTLKINTISVTNLNPGGYDNANDNSLVLLFDIDGSTILLPGDISACVEADIFTDLDLTIDIFKASHHGSSSGNSELLLDTIKPKFILYSAGSPNYYGHPSLEVQQRAKQRKIIELNTYSDGEIRFSFLHGLTMVLTSSGQYGVWFHV